MIQVLIVEDDFRIAAIHQQLLNKIKEVNVIGTVGSGDEVINFLQKNKEVNLILLDIYIPNKLGIDLIPIIRSKFPKIDIIVISASTEKAHVEQCLKYGVLYYFIKPLTFENLQQTIQNYAQKKMLIENQVEIDQVFIDSIFTNEVPTEKSQYPKGIDPLSLENARNILKGFTDYITTEEMAEKMGVSRTTARRYLEYLVSTNEIKAELVYGIVGRPERKYIVKLIKS